MNLNKECSVQMKENPKGKEASDSCLTGIYIDIHRRLEQMPRNDPTRTTLNTIGNGLAELITLSEGLRRDAAKFHSIDAAKEEILKLKAQLEEQKKLNDRNVRLLSERTARVIELEGAAKAISEQLERVIKERDQDKREHELSVGDWKKRCEDSVSKGRVYMTRMVAFTLQMVKEKLEELGLEEHVSHFESIDPMGEVRKALELVRKQREQAPKAGKKRKTTDN